MLKYILEYIFNYNLSILRPRPKHEKSQNLAEDTKVNLLTRGLRPKLKGLVIMKNPTTMETARQAMLLAERTVLPEVSSVRETELAELIRQMTLNKQEEVLQYQGQPPTQFNRQQQQQQTQHFQRPQQPQMSYQQYDGRPTQPQHYSDRQHRPTQPPRPITKQGSQQKECGRCGLMIESGMSSQHYSECPAKTCFCCHCHKTGHYPHKCYRQQKQQSNQKYR